MRTKSFHSVRSRPDCRQRLKLLDDLGQARTQPCIQQRHATEIAGELEFRSRKFCAPSIARRLQENRQTLHPRSAQENGWRGREWCSTRAEKFLRRIFARREPAERK